MRYAYRPPPRKLSATTISHFSDCEQQFAYERMCADVPAVLEPLPFVFGNVIHTFNQRLWNESKEDALGNKKYGFVFLEKVFQGAHGPKSEKQPPISIRWLSRRERGALGASEVEGKIKEKKERYMAAASLALEALYLERIAPNPFVRTEVEFNLGNKGLVIRDNHASIAYPLSGYIDRIHFLADGEYILLDLKTGEARKVWKRNEIVRSIQMTLYQFGAEKLFGRLPRAMFIVALSDATKELLKRAEEEVREGLVPSALDKIRIPVEIRRDRTHYTNLAHLAADVLTAIRMVISPSSFSKRERTHWEPSSYWGRMANFVDNVREERFIPRVGEAWCDNCPFLDLCREDNPEDWQRYYQSLSVQADSSGVEEESTASPPPPAEPEPQGELFGLPPKPKRLRKSDRELRRELIASGNFVKPEGIVSVVKKIHKLIPPQNGELCPCRRLNLVSISLLGRIEEYRKGKLRFADLLAACPYEGCPFHPSH